MLQKVVPYGTKMTGKVEGVDALNCPPHAPNSVIVIGDDNEGYVMVRVTHAIVPRKGQRVEMQFCNGGPTGGYWKIMREVKNG